MINNVYSCSVIQHGTDTAGCAALAFLFFAADLILHIAFSFWWPLFTIAFVVFCLESFIANDCNCSFSAHDNKKIFGDRGHAIDASTSSIDFIRVLFIYGYNHMN